MSCGRPPAAPTEVDFGHAAFLGAMSVNSTGKRSCHIAHRQYALIKLYYAAKLKSAVVNADAILRALTPNFSHAIGKRGLKGYPGRISNIPIINR
jgi:hypothetical protein